MCGIAGLSLKVNNPLIFKRFSKIINYLNHRGPDSSGFYKDKNMFIIYQTTSKYKLCSRNCCNLL